MIEEIVILILVLFLMLNFYLLVRNNIVFKSRMRISKKIYEHNEECIDNGTYKTEAINYFYVDNIYTYHEMVFKLWKPVRIMEAEILMELKLQ